MPLSQIRELSDHFEIGAHTLNHVTLTSLPASEAWAEISGSKQWIEDSHWKARGFVLLSAGEVQQLDAWSGQESGFSGCANLFLQLARRFLAIPFFGESVRMRIPTAGQFNCGTQRGNVISLVS